MAAAEITDEFIGRVLRTIKRGKRIRRTLQGDGRLSIDKSLPYLLLYRFRGKRPDKGLVKLIAAEAQYLIVPAEADAQQTKKLVNRIAEHFSNDYGSFLLLEMWLSRRDDKKFIIYSPEGEIGSSTVDELKEHLLKFKSVYIETEVEEKCGRKREPEGLERILPMQKNTATGMLTLGLQIPTIFRSKESGHTYPVFLRVLRRFLSRAVREAVFDFIRVQTSASLGHVQMLGRRSVSPSVWHIDQRLAEIEASYQFLLLVAPVNSETAWEAFQESKYTLAPRFRYRILPVDPDELKRKLYNIKIENVEDPTLSQLFRNKREELDIQITMLAERNTPRFMYSGIRLYQGVEKELVDIANGILAAIPDPGEGSADEVVDARGFKKRAQQEYEYYKKQYPAFPSKIEIRKDLTGLMVSHGNLLIDHNLCISASRLEALIHHEVGTHVLTYCNGHAQPLRQLYHGLEDYDELQEGLAVLAEYLVGGFNRARLRLLAARVVAADCLMKGYTFPETFQMLCDNNFSPPTSFSVVSRIYASGGFIKDVIYLRGLVNLMRYLREGNPIEPLYIGKIALRHVPLVEELRLREVLRDIPLLPRYLQTGQAQERLQKVREGLIVTSMVD